MTAYLVGEIDESLSEVDTRSAIANIVLTALVKERPPGNLVDLINAQVLEIRKERKKNRDGYLIIEVMGELNEYNPSVERKSEGIHIAIDAISKEEIRLSFEDKIKSTLAALTLLSNKIIGFENVSEGVVLYKDDGSIIYPFTFKGGIASAYVSSPLSGTTLDSVDIVYRQIIQYKELERIVGLLVSSLWAKRDLLRSFLTAWTALEIFVNKTFRKFEGELFAELKGGNHPGTRGKYLDRIREVMKDKYKLNDKFAVIALRLSAQTADRDAIKFNKIKKQRDDFFHGFCHPTQRPAFN